MRSCSYAVVTLPAWGSSSIILSCGISVRSYLMLSHRRSCRPAFVSIKGPSHGFVAYRQQNSCHTNEGSTPSIQFKSVWRREGVITKSRESKRRAEKRPPSSNRIETIALPSQLRQVTSRSLHNDELITNLGAQYKDQRVAFERCMN
jgi:hypothetical protein